MEINYAINTPSIIKLNGYAKCFDILNELLVIGKQNGKLDLYEWSEEKQLIKDYLNTSDKEQVINVKFHLKNDENYLFTQNRCGVLNFLIIDTTSDYSLKLICSVNTNTETYTRFSFLSNLIYLPLLEKAGLKVIELSYQDYCFNKEMKEIDFKNENQELKIESVGLVMTISEFLIEDKYLILGFETATISIYNTQSSKLICSKIKFFDSNESNSYVLSLTFYQHSQGKYTIFVSFFSCQIAVFLFDINLNHLEFIKPINNCCFNLKPGISSMSVINETILGQKTGYLVTGSYDYRIRFYELHTYNALGHINYNQSRINQVRFIKNDQNIFLFVASDESSFYIWLIL